jgi:ABC-type nitrate/sulfonate/bicarbonate transport system substrate-binding protein
MGRVAALLAAALLAAGAAGCGGSGAEPGAPEGATIVLDFTPNAVHSGIYAALRQGFYRDAGVDLTVRQPGASTDAPRLLEAGRADFAILDIHDLGIARELGLDLVGVMPIVQRPLASVLARADGPVRRPRDLEGHTVGVTGLPSDEAVVDSEVSADGGDPARVHRVTIGFDAVASLASGKVDAATGFWNAEAVALREKGVPIRVFKVDEYGAPPYPELILTTSLETLGRRPKLVNSVVAATSRGYRFAAHHPDRALGDLLSSVPGLVRAEQAAQLHALLPVLAPAPFDPAVLREWAAWDLEHGLLKRPLDVNKTFRIEPGTLLGSDQRPG